MSFKLRDYQEAAINALEDHYKTEDTGILVLPTGAGKTFTTWSFLKDKIKGRCSVLWVVHRSYLLDQALEQINRLLPNAKVSYWTADQKDLSGDIVLCMIMSTRTIHGSFDWLVYDECHRSGADSYENLESLIKFKKKLGITATPCRPDYRDLRLGKIVYQVTFGELVEKQYLAKPNINIIKTKQKIKYKMSGDDISSESLKLFDNYERNLLIVQSLFKKGIEGKIILIFCCNVSHTESLMHMINETVEKKVATCVHSNLSKEETEKNLLDFSKGKYSVLCNCQKFTEGYDQKNITDVVMARPTLSPIFWVQAIGRGARIDENKNSYDIWVFMDDINKYDLLVTDWSINNLNKDPVTNIPIDRNALATTKAFLDIHNVPVPDSYSELLKVIGVVRTVPKYDKNVINSYSITHERYISLVLLAWYFSNIPKDNDLKFYIQKSYQFCVNNGEFTQKEWKDVAWAFFFKGDSYCSEWIQKPKLDKDYILSLVNDSLESNKAFNEHFANIVYDYGGSHMFLNHINEKILKESRKLNKIANSIYAIEYSDRTISLKSSMVMPSRLLEFYTDSFKDTLSEILGYTDFSIFINLRTK